MEAMACCNKSFGILSPPNSKLGFFCKNVSAYFTISGSSFIIMSDIAAVMSSFVGPWGLFGS